jgi:hypothetical protein
MNANVPILLPLFPPNPTISMFRNRMPMRSNQLTMTILTLDKRNPNYVQGLFD